MPLQIIKPGLLTLLQDYGRFGMQHYGITNSGPMDESAFLWANRLLKNSFNAPQLEICMGGFTARFDKASEISLCGADLMPRLNNMPIKMWQTHAVQKGDTLRFEGTRSGLYAYLAIKDGFQVQPQLFSCATVIREQLGGLLANGEKIAEGNVLEYAEYTGSNNIHSVMVPDVFIPNYHDSITVRFIPNVSENGCDKKTIHQFSRQTFQVSNQINRMGYRLQGKAITTTKSNIISQGLNTGSIQLPNDGKPIVLMKDRQTIGGYPLLGCVASLDLAKLSQSKPGTKVKFKSVEIVDLEPMLQDHLDFFNISYGS